MFSRSQGIADVVSLIADYKAAGFNTEATHTRPVTDRSSGGSLKDSSDPEEVGTVDIILEAASAQTVARADALGAEVTHEAWCAPIDDAENVPRAFDKLALGGKTFAVVACDEGDGGGLFLHLTLREAQGGSE